MGCIMVSRPTSCPTWISEALHDTNFSQMRKCLHVDTLVRTSDGVQKISDINVGDMLYDEHDRPVLCTAVAPVESGPLKEVHYTEFESQEKKSFVCTPDHILPLRVASPLPAVNRKTGKNPAVNWLSRCNRNHIIKEAEQMLLDNLADTLYRDLIHSWDSNPSPDEVHEYVDSVVDEHFHGGHVEYSNRIDSILRAHENSDLKDDPDAVKQALHDAMSTQIEYRIIQAANDEDDDDIEPEVFNLEEEEFDSQSSGGTYVPGASQSSCKGGSQDSIIADPTQSFGSVASSQLPVDETDRFKFDELRKSLENKCTCPGFREVSKRFQTEKQAQLVYKVLCSDKYHLIDPFLVRDGDVFHMTLQQYEEDLCTKRVKEKYLKLYRSPVIALNDTRTTTEVPLDPWFLGYWLGDGAKDCPAIYSNDIEVKRFLENYVAKLNSGRPTGVPPVRLQDHITTKAGSEIGTTGYFRNSDTHCYRISGTPGPNLTVTNPVLKGLRDLGLLGDKSGGIPDCYMNADLQTRCAVIAGLIDSDGSYHAKKGHYQVSQTGEDHKKIVYDLKELARSCGISVYGVTTMQRTTGQFFTGNTRYEISLGKGNEILQPYLLVPRKRIHRPVQFHDHDIRRIFKISDAGEGRYRAIQVSGGVFQLENRLIVHNCHLNTCKDILTIIVF